MSSQITKKRIPVILDTDIGTDIDDTWAIALMLNSPELDVKMILSESGDTDYRARIIAKLLETAGRTDIPVGVGLRGDGSGEPQGAWIRGYNLDSYPGVVFRDGVTALIDLILASEEKITVIAIGPVTNIAAALDRQPAITKKARFAGMQGSVRKGYTGEPAIAPEYNVVADAAACRKVFSAPWDVTVTPLDTCGLVTLSGEKYARVRDCPSPLIRALMENYALWSEYYFQHNQRPRCDETASSVLYDTVAVFLAFSEEMLILEDLGLRVTDDGCTWIDENARKIRCATAWTDLGAFEDFLVRRLTG